MKWIAGSSIHSCWLGWYELDKQVAIKPYIKPGMTVFDIGANAGFYTLAFSRLVGAQGRVWAFEPLAENVSNLIKHIRLNNLSNTTLVQAVVAGSSGIVGFDTEGKLTGAISEEEFYKVPTVALDNLVESNAAPVPDVIKIDVEGAESMVLEGARSLLQQKRPILFLALHGDEETSRCLRILRFLRYKVFFLDGTPLDVTTSRNDEEIYAVPD